MTEMGSEREAGLTAPASQGSVYRFEVRWANGNVEFINGAGFIIPGPHHPVWAVVGNLKPILAAGSEEILSIRNLTLTDFEEEEN